MEVKINQLQKLIYSYAIKKKPFFIHGSMGIGKSQTVRTIAKKIAKEKGKAYLEGTYEKDTYSLIDVRLSNMDPSDLKGIPFPDSKVTKWLPPNWLPTSGEGIIFFDELNLANPSIQASAYELILDRRLGDYALPEGWVVIAAGNRPEDKANVYPMPYPLRNRFSHATLLVPTEEDWKKWAVANNLKPDIISFMAFKPTMLFKFDATSKDNAFPTPRTWALASHMIEGVTNSEEEFLLVATCVGEGPAIEYSAFLVIN